MRGKRLGRWVAGCATAGLFGVAVLFGGGLDGSTLSKSVADEVEWTIINIRPSGGETAGEAGLGEAEVLESTASEVEWT